MLGYTCSKGYEKEGGKMVPNCVPKEGLDKEDEPKVKSIIKIKRCK